MFFTANGRKNVHTTFINVFMIHLFTNFHSTSSTVSLSPSSNQKLYLDFVRQSCCFPLPTKKKSFWIFLDHNYEQKVVFTHTYTCLCFIIIAQNNKNHSNLMYITPTPTPTLTYNCIPVTNNTNNSPKRNSHILNLLKEK